jgi:acyl-CoA thioester hydrolase
MLGNGYDQRPSCPDMRSRMAERRVVSRPAGANGVRDEFDLHALPDDIDHMGHVNNAVYLSWVQDMIVRHWTSNASESEVASHLWVAVKHEITYRRPAFLDDAIHATVKATGFKGARGMFDTVIRRGDEVVAEIRSVWCCLDVSTRRPMRVAREIVQRFLGSTAALAG